MSAASTPALDPGDDRPDFTVFAGRLGPGAAKLRSVRELHAWLASLDPVAPLEIRGDRLEALARWLRTPGAIPQRELVDAAEPPATRRLRLLIDALAVAPGYGARFRALVAGVLGESQALGFLEAGLPNQRGVGAETGDRLARRFLPVVRSPRDLLALVGRMFPGKRDGEWLASLPADLVDRLAAEIDGAVLTGALVDEMHLGAVRVSSLGLSKELRLRASETPLRESPFFQLPRAIDALVAAPSIEALDTVEAIIASCRNESAVVLAHLEEFGVSVDVVYRLEVIAKNLERLELLARLVVRPTAEGARALFAVIVDARRRDRSLRDLMGSNAQLLARKVIERAGQSGEHYITRTRAEYWGMIASAGGGGILTAFTAYFKFSIGSGHFPLFVEGLAASINYAGSFLLMQLLGLTLATKQPSMTAAALAGAIREPRGPDRLEPLVTVVARICRSQLAAAIGNVGMVIPAALVFDLVWRHHSGHPLIDEHQAEHTLESLDPRHASLYWFGALTGVILWASSLCAGWLENWSTYRRLPDAIAQHRVGSLVGRRTMRWLSRQLKHGISGIGGNVAIGVLLGMVPVIGKFLGLPLEVRHLTLSTGSLTLAISSLGTDAWLHGAFWCIAGIAVIGALNFGVSFGLALAVALRARAVEHGERRLLLAVLRRFFRSPIEFFFPPSTNA